MDDEGVAVSQPHWSRSYSGGSPVRSGPSGAAWKVVKESYGSKLWEGALWLYVFKSNSSLKLTAFVREPGLGVSSGKVCWMGSSGEDVDFPTLEEALDAADGDLASKDASYRLSGAPAGPGQP